MKWQAVSAQALRLTSWDDEFVVYNGLSGDTHLLDLTTGQILRAVCDAPADIEELAGSLGEFWHVHPDEEFRVGIQRILNDLRALALVEHC